jgi:Leucine-rich repeat (LRR) protein
MSTPTIGKITSRLTDFSAGAEPQPLEAPKGLAPYGDQRTTAIAAQFADVPPANAAPTSAQEHVALAQAAGSASQDGAARLGAQAAQHLGIKPSDYTADELAVLGEEVVLDNLLSGDMQDFVQTLQPPTRLGVARQLLLDLGLDPERLVDTPELIDPENLLATNARRKAADYYFNRDSLSATDLQWMSDHLRSDAELQRMLARLPASLDAEFGKRFDAYANRISAQGVRLLENSIASLVRQHGIDPAAATVTLSRAKLQYYTREVDVHYLTAVQYDKTQAEITGQGYFVSIQASGAQYRYFVSTHTGQALALPGTGGPHAWMADHRDTVFDKTQADAALGGRRNEMASRVMMEPIGSGALQAMPQWLAPVFRADVQRVREAARGHTPAEVANEALLNSVIPFRRMVTAFDKGDMKGEYYMFLLSVLELMFLLPTGAALTKGLTAVVRMGLASYRTAGIMGLQQMGTQLPGIRESIRLALATIKTTSQAWRRLRPLDTERLAVALRPVSPKLANELEKIAMRARGATVPDGAWKVPAASDTTLAADNAIDTARIIQAQGRNGGELPLLPYGGNGRTYTQYDVSLEQRTGAVLLADRDGWLYSSLPLTTLQRYRVTAPDLLQALTGRRAGGDGAIALGERHYARIGEDYVQVIDDMAVSTAERPIWRAVAPDGVAPDIIAHRLIHDADKALWRQADVPELKGGGLFGKQTVQAPTSVRQLAPTAEQQAQFLDTLVQGIRGGATTQQVEAVRTLLRRIEADTRGNAILKAMSAYHELLGEAPKIVLRQEGNTALPRPSLYQQVQGNVWHLDLAALAELPTRDVVTELAAVYNNMTDILESRDPFAALRRTDKLRLPAELEKAWKAWESREKGSFTARAAQKAVSALGRPIPGGWKDYSFPSDLIKNLRYQLQNVRAFGGMPPRALQAVLQEQAYEGLVGIRVDIPAHNRVNTLPPLPADLERLDISNAYFQSPTELPDGLKSLWIRADQLPLLPAPLPKGLIALRVEGSLTKLPVPLPTGLRKLTVKGGVTSFPDVLPESLEELKISGYGLLTIRLPSIWPSGLKKLNISGNRLSDMPQLPSALIELDISRNHFLELPAPLPATLQKLNAGQNRLISSPDVLPADLEELHLYANRLTEFPRNLPARLRILHLESNRLTQLPDSINSLTDVEIFIAGNPIPFGNIPAPIAGQPGPQIHFPRLAATQSRTVAQAVGYWLEGRPEIASLWNAIAIPDNAEAFSHFLDRLRDTIMYRDEAQRAVVVKWLKELAERPALRQDSLAFCLGATETCDDRVVSTWNELQRLQLNDDIRIGRYDAHPDQVVQAARQMFRLRVLEEIAKHKMQTVSRVGVEVEVYLAYAVKLRNQLGLTTIVPEMNFFNLSEVTQNDLAQALSIVQAREAAEFDRFLVLDYEPWQTLLKRKDPAAYAAAEDALHELVETRFEQRLEEEIARLGLDPTHDAAAIADARKDLGRPVMRELQYGQLAPLTRKHQLPAGDVLPVD